MDAGAALDEEVRDAAGGELREEVAQVHPALPAPAAQELDARARRRRVRAEAWATTVGAGERGWRSARRGGQREVGVEHHADRVAAAAAREPRREERVVGARGARRPTSTASTRSRSRCTQRRASSPVTQRASPVRVAMRPSSVTAALSVT